MKVLSVDKVFTKGIKRILHFFKSVCLLKICWVAPTRKSQSAGQNENSILFLRNIYFLSRSDFLIGGDTLSFQMKHCSDF